MSKIKKKTKKKGVNPLSSKKSTKVKVIPRTSKILESDVESSQNHPKNIEELNQNQNENQNEVKQVIEDKEKQTSDGDQNDVNFLVFYFIFTFFF